MKHSCPNAVLAITSTNVAASATDAKNRLGIVIPPLYVPAVFRMVYLPSTSRLALWCAASPQGDRSRGRVSLAGRDDAVAPNLEADHRG